MARATKKSLNDVRQQVENIYKQYLKEECIVKPDGLPVPDDVRLKTIELEKIFVPARFAIVPEKWDEIQAEFSDAYVDAHEFWFGIKTPIEREDVNMPIRSIVFSGPGGGKTTYMRRLISAYGLNRLDDWLPNRSMFPIWIKCRDYDDISNKTILEIIGDIPMQPEASFTPTLREAFNELILEHLQKDTALILIDGLDEIKDAENRRDFVYKLEAFIKEYKNVSVILTSRIVGFNKYTSNSFKSFRRWYIMPFNEREIPLLCEKWHKILFGDKKSEARSAEDISNAIINNERLKNFAKNPILLTTLLLLNKQYGGLLPIIRRKDLYFEAIKVLLYTWRAGDSSIDPELARPHLSYLAHQMSFNRNMRQRIGGEELKEILEKAKEKLDAFALYGKHKEQFISEQQFIDRVEERSSLLVQRGLRDNEKVYEFQHLTFQEFLAAYAIVEEHYPKQDDNHPIYECFDGKWESPELKEILLFTFALANARQVKELTNKLLERLDEIKENRSIEREDAILYLKNILLQIIIDKAWLTPEYRKKIYNACYTGFVSTGNFRNEFMTIYNSEYKQEFITKLFETDKERRRDFLKYLFKLLELRESDPMFSTYSNFIKMDDNDEGAADVIMETIRLMQIDVWLGWSNKPKDIQNIKNKLLYYIKNGRHNIAVTALFTFCGLHHNDESVFNGELLRFLSKFDMDLDVIQQINMFPISQDTLIFLRNDKLSRKQINELNELIKKSMNSFHLIKLFWFGVHCGAWGFNTVLKKAREFHYANYISKEKSIELFRKMCEYLSVLREEKHLTEAQEISADKYESELHKHFTTF